MHKNPRALPRSQSTAVSGRGRLLAAILLLLTFALVAAPAAEVQARAAPDSFADLAEKLLPTVVNISTTQQVESSEGGIPDDFRDLFRDFFERRGQRGQEPQPAPPIMRRATALGSGFIIDPSGYIVTNFHVVDGADEITVRLADDTNLKAKLIGGDDKTDLALLKVESPKPLPAAHWGDSDSIRVGDWVLAIGNPFGLGGTVTAGIISARQRDINAGPYDDFLQTDASINRGNSGGPTFNMEGEVVGVNTAIYSPSGGSIGIGFAIPSVMARNIIDSLRRFGEVRRGWLGVRIQTVTEELAEGLRLPNTHGALVASVSPTGPAAEAGIEQGDVILEFNGRPVVEMRNLPRLVAETPVGDKVDVDLWRKGERKTVQVTVGLLDEAAVAALTPESPPKEGQVPTEQSLEGLGLTLGELTSDTRQRFGLADDSKGVLVTGVTPAGPAAEKGFRPGDLIIEVDQEAVTTPEDVSQRIAKAKSEGFRVVTVLVRRASGGDVEWVALPITGS